jgi:hypothetical protein
MVSGVTIRRDGREAASAEHLPFHGQSTSLVVCETQSGTVSYAEDPVLLTQVVDDVLLVSVNPAGDKQDEE